MGKFICDFGTSISDRMTIIESESITDLAISDTELTKFTMDEIKKYSQEHSKLGVDITYINTVIGYKCTDMSEITKIFILAKQAKIKYVSCYGYSLKSGCTIEEAVNQYKQIVVLAKQYGITLFVRNHHNTILNKADKLLDFVKQMDMTNLKICFDTAEFIRCGEIILPAYRYLKEEVGMIFLNDINDYYDEVPFGIGVCKISDFMAVLKKDGYKGMFSINVSFPTYERRQSIYKKTNIFNKFRKQYKSCLAIDEKLGKTKKEEVTIKYLAALQIRYIGKLIQ